MDITRLPRSGKPSRQSVTRRQSKRSPVRSLPHTKGNEILIPHASGKGEGTSRTGLKYEWTSGDDPDTWEPSAASATDSTLSAHDEASAEYPYYNSTGWNEGNSYDATGTSEQRWAESRLQGATGYGEAALVNLVPGVIMGGSPGIGRPSHAPPSIGFALPPSLGLGDDTSGGNQQNSPADEVVFERPPSTTGATLLD